jgi:hypothetical protein
VFADGHELKADREYGSHGERISGISVPLGAIALRGSGLLDATARENDKGEEMGFSAYGYRPEELGIETQRIALELGQLGLGKDVRIRDLWSHRDLGTFSGSFVPEIEWHGARLYRVSAAGP